MNAEQARKQAARATPKTAQALVDRVRTGVKTRARDGHRGVSLVLGKAAEGAVAQAVAALIADGFTVTVDEQLDRLEVKW